ncbi:MAG: hypothetical protein JWP61_494, partial [Friedmanniella sp.]|nr:hypothetical protein [Friedmanniella sp.]
MSAPPSEPAADLTSVPPRGPALAPAARVRRAAATLLG